MLCGRCCAIFFLAFTLKIIPLEAVKKCELKSTSGNTQFPSSFQFGVSTSAYQIEGGGNEDGKGPSVWDTLTHNHPEQIDDRSTGDDGPDSYHRFEQDLAALKELKVNFYRFSISWSRVLPKGDTSSINQKGIDFYNMVIDKLLENNIEPMVTMFHDDMPEELNKFGGLINPLFIEYFRSYAGVLFKNFGDRVKLWITFNEAYNSCHQGFSTNTTLPGITDYLCIDIILKAHASTYRLYKRDFKNQDGKLGITIMSSFFFSKTKNTTLVDRALQFSVGWLANPLFGTSGNYPTIMLETIANNSIKEGRTRSRLVPLEGDWPNIIKGAADFLGFNYYTGNIVQWANTPLGEVPSFDYDSHLKLSIDPEWKTAKSFWIHCVPKGLEGLLKWVRDNYNNIEVMIHENGWSDDGQLVDVERIDYLKAHLQAVLNALNDGCNVTHYTYWTLMDNFEWHRGLTEKFGLYYVNMSSSKKERIAKSSAWFYRNVIESKSIPNN